MTTDFEEPVDVDPMSSREVAKRSGPAFLYDFNHRLIVFRNDEIRDVVFRSRVGMVSPRIEIDIVAVNYQLRLSRLFPRVRIRLPRETVT